MGTLESIYRSIINTVPPQPEAQLPMRPNKMSFSRMDPQHVCVLCAQTFSKKSNIVRHINNTHHQVSVKQECADCGKTFNRKDNLKQHQSICLAIRFKCPRCHHILQDIPSLTRHMGLCPEPKCTVCQEQFVDLNQLQEHKKTHTKKRKATSIPDSKMKKGRRRNHGDFHCRVCLDSFITREELFHHKLKHMEDPRPYRPVEPHFDGEDERMNSMLRENAGFIFISHRFTPVSADFNFPLNLLLNEARWSDNIFQTLDLVANISNDESFKLNLSMGVILTHREKGELRFFVPHANNAFLKKNDLYRATILLARTLFTTGRGIPECLCDSSPRKHQVDPTYDHQYSHSSLSSRCTHGVWGTPTLHQRP